MMLPEDLKENEYASYYSNYLKLLKSQNLIEYLEISLHEFIKFVRNIPLDKYEYVYAKDKWTIRQIIQHLIDCERIFSYRALRISRGDKSNLASFDEEFYASQANVSQRSISSLLSELSTVRESTISLFKSLNTEELERVGFASGQNISVRAIGFILIGHQTHHQQIYCERYL